MNQVIQLMIIGLVGAVTGLLVIPYTQWMVSLRRASTLKPAEPAPMGFVLFAPLANAFAWILSFSLIASPAEALELSLLVTAALALTAIDHRIRIIPNELVAALLALCLAFALLEGGLSVLPGKLLGLVVGLVLFVVVAMVGRGKIGGGDVKLAMVMGFAAGFPNILVAIVAMGIASVLSWAFTNAPWNIKWRTPLPFAGFMMIGLIAALILDKAHLLAALGL